MNRKDVGKELGGLRTNYLLIKLFYCKGRHTKLSLAWIDYRKAYDMIPHCWILECLDIFGIAGTVKQFVMDSMLKWKVELTSMEKSLGDVPIRRGVFQGDSLSPLLF